MGTSGNLINYLGSSLRMGGPVSILFGWIIVCSLTIIVGKIIKINNNNKLLVWLKHVRNILMQVGYMYGVVKSVYQNFHQ